MAGIVRESCSYSAVVDLLFIARAHTHTPHAHHTASHHVCAATRTYYRQSAIKLREKELNLYTENFSAMATQAAVLAGKFARGGSIPFSALVQLCVDHGWHTIFRLCTMHSSNEVSCCTVSLMPPCTAVMLLVKSFRRWRTRIHDHVLDRAECAALRKFLRKALPALLKHRQYLCEYHVCIACHHHKHMGKR
jgi:hypothetical protein